MSNKPPIVPSKTALHVLRRLAFSSPTLLIGAAGSACGIAALNYEARRRVRLAEKIVHTKQIIRSVSNGRGALQLANMIKAAESGEDFLLDPTKAHKRRRVRNYSALGEARVQEHNENVQIYDYRSDDPRIADAKDKTNSEGSGDGDGNRTSSSGMNRPSHFHPLYGKPNRGPVSRISSLSDQMNPSRSTAHVAQKHKDAHYQATTLRKQGQDDGPRVQYAGAFAASHNTSPDATSPVATMLQAEPIEQAPEPANNEPEHSPPISPTTTQLQRTNHVAVNETKERFPSTVLSEPIPTLHGLSHNNGTSVKTSKTPRSSLRVEPKEGTYTAQAADRSSASTPVDDGIFSKAWSDWTAAQTTFEDIDAELEDQQSLRGELVEDENPEYNREYSRIVRSSETEILHHQSRGSSDKSLDTMSDLDVRSDEEDSFILPIRKISANPLRIIRQSSPSDGEVLSPHSFISRVLAEAAIGSTETFRTTLASSWMSDPSKGWLFDASRTILRTLYLADDSYMAEQLVGEIEATSMARSSISGILVFTRFLVCEMARASDWGNIRRIMKRLHLDGVSRLRARKFSNMFERVYNIYAARHSTVESYNFLVDAMYDCGTVPTQEVVATFMASCIKSRRYDFIQEWYRADHIAYINSQVVTKNYYGIWCIGKTWEEMSASCEDIEQACQALAYGALYNRFSRDFKAVAHEAVKRDLSTRLVNAINSVKGQQSSTETDYILRMDLHDLFESSHELISYCSKSNIVLPTAKQAKLRALLRQISAVSRLNDLFAGGDVCEELSVAADEWTPRSSLKKVHQQHSPQIQALLEGDDLPSLDQILEVMRQSYDYMKSKCLPVSHGFLKPLTTKLIIAQREAQAVALLSRVYSSAHVHGPEGALFDLDLFTHWLRTTIELKMVEPTKSCLEATIETSRHLQFPASFFVLCKYAIQRFRTFQKPRSEKSESSTATYAEDFDYLERRLNHIRLVQEHAQPERKRFSEFKSWQERTRE